VARELQVLLWNGCPDRAAMSADWRPVTSPFKVKIINNKNQ
jgi:hypothetical protein